MNARSAAAASLAAVALLVGSCAHEAVRHVTAQRPAASAQTTLAETSPVTPRPTASDRTTTDDASWADAGTTGLLRVVGVYRSCANPPAIDVRFATASQLTPGVRLVARDRHGRVLRSASHTLPVTVASTGDGAVQQRGTRATWRLLPAAGPPLPRGEAGGWTITLVSTGSSRDLAHPTQVTLPSCAAGAWLAPTIRLAVTEVSRDCTAASPMNEYVSVRLRATGLVDGLGYRLEGTGLGATVNNLEPFGTRVDKVIELSPMPDVREGAGLPPPFPSTAFTAALRLQAEGDDGFTQAERSADVFVDVPACQPGSSAAPAAPPPWNPNLPAVPTS